MRIGVDLDGVICDWHKGVADVINSIWPARIPPGGEYPPEWELTSLGLSKAELGEVFQRIEGMHNWYMGLPAIVRNVHAVWHHRIMRPEDEIFYVTARTTETKGLPIMDSNNGGTGVGYADTLTKVAALADRSADTIVNGHNATTTTPADIHQFIGFVQEFVKTVQDGKKSGMTADEVAKAWKTPAKFPGYEAMPIPVRVLADAQLIFSETK
jgi:hypothetical protein